MAWKWSICSEYGACSREGCLCVSAGMQRSIESASVQAGLSSLSKPGLEAWEQPKWSGQQAVCSGGPSSSNTATLRHLWEACSADLALLLQADQPGGSSGPWQEVNGAVLACTAMQDFAGSMPC